MPEAIQYRPVQLDKVILDRGSVFTATLFPARTVEEVRWGLEHLVQGKKFRTASHNVVAYRLRGDGTLVVEHKDDGYSGRGRESGAGRVVLEVLRAKDALDVVVVVTRWFGGIPLGGARFRHFGNAAALVLDAGNGAQLQGRGST